MAGSARRERSRWRATPKICPLTSFGRIRQQVHGERRDLEVSIVFSVSTRSFWSGVSVGIEPIMRLQAKGAMQFERTWYFAMSSASTSIADDAELGGGVVA